MKSQLANGGAKQSSPKTAFEFCGVKPTVYGSQPLISVLEAVVSDPAGYRCKSPWFSRSHRILEVAQSYQIFIFGDSFSSRAEQTWSRSFVLASAFSPAGLAPRSELIQFRSALPAQIQARSRVRGSWRFSAPQYAGLLARMGSGSPCGRIIFQQATLARGRHPVS